MIKLLISLPLIGIISIKLTQRNRHVTKREEDSSIVNILRILREGRVQGIIYSIITLYVSLYMLLLYNNNNVEYQYRETIDLLFYKVTIGVDGISMSLIILTTILTPILILLKEKRQEDNNYTPKLQILEDKYGEEKNSTKLVEVPSTLSLDLSLDLSLERRKKEGVYEEGNIVIILLIIESMLILLFTSIDLLIFYILLECMLIPMYILIGRYGSKERRIEAANRYIIYSLIGSLLMVISIIIMYIKYGTTNNEILLLKVTSEEIYLLRLYWISFFISFAIKIPIYPFHTWLPFVHVEAPTIGSMLLAGIMLKLGTYGIIRYNIGVFGEINNYFIPIVIIMALLSIFYGSLTTIRQIDLKKIIAYSSIVHMNYGVIGYFTNELEGLIGSTFQMISHAFVSCGLFLLVGLLYKRYHTRILLYYNGLIYTMPLFGTMWIIFTLSNISLPLTSSFISEILILLSSFKFNLFLAFSLSLALLFSTVYPIWLSNRVLFGQISSYIKEYKEITKTEIVALIPLIGFTILLGIYNNMLLSLYTLPLINLLS